jgi:Flp pilus assembly protein TadB
MAVPGSEQDGTGRRTRRQFVVFSLIAVVVVWLIVIATYSHGTIHVVGVILGLPAIAVLLWIGLRFLKASKERPNL